MNKMRFRILLFLLLFITLFSSSVMSQEGKEDKLLEENPLKKGSCAIIFEFGALFGSSSNIEEYNFLFKYHCKDNTALRINLSLKGNKEKENFYDRNDFKEYGLQGSITYQIFISKKYFAKPFVSAGPYFLQNYVNNTNSSGDYYKYNSWELGIILTIGAEAFVYKNIGIIGEYVFRGYYGKETDEKYCRSCRTSFEQNESSMYKFRANTCRLGISFYF